MAYLLDTNILLRFSRQADPRHPEVYAAVEHLRERNERLCFAPQNAAELWNVMTRPVDRNGFGETPAATDALLNKLETVFAMLPDDPAMYGHWRRLVRAAAVSGVQVHDARLVAWMQAHGVTHLLTLNAADFARYADLAGIVVVEPAQLARTSEEDDVAGGGRPAE